MYSPFRLRSFINHSAFHPGIIVWLPAVNSSVQNYKTIVLEVENTSQVLFS